MFLKLEIDGKKAEPGVMPIKIRKGSTQLTVQYELGSRKRKTDFPRGVNTADLIYLILPDRFANANPDNDVIEGMKQANIDRQGIKQRHGGDLEGIMAHLDYVQELGATSLWLNPVLENDQPAESYHGYAATDLYRVDRRLGSNELFRDLVDSCHARGIKMIMDVVHNHVGNEHFFIRDLPASDWIHQFDTFTKSSFRAPTLLDPYASEFDRNLMANGWFDEHMPDLNQKNPHLATYLIQNNLWWITYADLDGFRIDTYAYPDQKFMAKWAKAILTEYPDFTLFAETWVHGVPVQAWFTEKTAHKDFDNAMQGVTDFQLYYAINHALTNPFGWTEGLSRIYYTLAKDYIYKGC